jgi:hypothetical protein
MRCPRCYKNKKKDEDTKDYPQMKIEEINNDEIFVCPLCDYTLLKD